MFSEVNSTLDKRSFRQSIDAIVKLTDEDAFDSLIDFLTKSVEVSRGVFYLRISLYFLSSVCSALFYPLFQRSFEERKRGDARKRWMSMIDAAAQTGGAQLDPVYRAVFHVLNKDAEEHGKGKIISASVSMLENNDDAAQLYRGETVLRYVACTMDDIPHVLGKILYRDMKAISWSVLDSGKPIHVPKVATHSGIVLWNHYRKQEVTCFLTVYFVWNHSYRRGNSYKNYARMVEAKIREERLA